MNQVKKMPILPPKSCTLFNPPEKYAGLKWFHLPHFKKVKRLHMIKTTTYPSSHNHGSEKWVPPIVSTFQIQSCSTSMITIPLVSSWRIVSGEIEITGGLDWQKVNPCRNWKSTPRKLTACLWKWWLGRFFSFWNGPSSEDMLIFGWNFLSLRNTPYSPEKTHQ